MSRAGFARKAPPSPWCDSCNNLLAKHITSTDIGHDDDGSRFECTIVAFRCRFRRITLICRALVEKQERGAIDNITVTGSLEV